MTVTKVERDLERRQFRITATYEVPIERAWQLWADPRQLERWWGPPGYPATFVQHELTPDAHVSYFMTSPEGDRYHGWWRVIAVEPPQRLVFEDGFADDQGAPNPDLPTSIGEVTLRQSAPGRTEMTIETTFPSQEAMEQVLAMGMEEGITLAMGQIDAILAT